MRVYSGKIVGRVLIYKQASNDAKPTNAYYGKQASKPIHFYTVLDVIAYNITTGPHGEVCYKGTIVYKVHIHIHTHDIRFILYNNIIQCIKPLLI
jgi:hypothetical protein